MSAKNSKPVIRPLALAIMAVISSQAFAQEKAANDNTPLNLDAIIVTGQPQGISKMKSSVSISTMSDEQITRTGATNAAEILRSIPGIRSESSGGEGNANLTVRGVPLSAGGARYVQFQEDGLPILLFGDIAFGTADQFLRSDFNVDRLEVIRGGSASTMATNSPGGIVNFISKTGKDTGGALGLTYGLDHRQTRYDFNYGAKDNDKTYTNIGGFFRYGEGGPRDAGMNVENGGQLKANITREFDGGYVRINFKGLNDKTPSLQTVPVTVDKTLVVDAAGAPVLKDGKQQYVISSNSQIHTVPGIDPRNAFFITPNLQRDTTLTRDGGLNVASTRDGLAVKSTAIGIESQFNLGNGWNLDERFRWAENSGRFIALFPSGNNQQFDPVTGALLPTLAKTFPGVLFNTSLDDMGNKVNDLKISKKFDLDGTKLTFTGGLFTGVQNVAETWFWNQYTVEAKGNGAAVTAVPGVAGSGFQTFGGCCVRNWDVQYTTTAPYVSLAGDFSGFNLDASFRRDSQKASGFTIEDNPATQTWDPATQKQVNYKVSHNSYSLGGNYSVSKDLAVFARLSDGVSFSADRLLFSKPVDGSLPIDINTIKQQEVGAKFRSGNFSTFVTLFNAKTKESNYEATTQLFTNNEYKSRGVEIEAGFRMGGFNLAGGLTYTNAKIDGPSLLYEQVQDPAFPTDPTKTIIASKPNLQVGNEPRRQAKVVYQFTPSYSFGDFELGAAVIGSGKSWGDDGNKIVMPAYAVVNGFAKYQLSQKFGISLSANNLTNKLAFTEIEGDGHSARALDGRTVKAALKYSF
jgi:outer membrane receptor protein involved in Fe transport